MPTRIEDLPAISSVEGMDSADILPIVDNSGTPTTKQVTVDILGTFIGQNYAQLSGDAVGDINMSGYSLNMNADGGTGGGNINMDGGVINFPDSDGNYSQPGTIRTGTFGDYGGLSLICYVGYELNWQAGFLSIGGPYNDGHGGTLLLNGGVLNMNAGAGTGGGSLNMDSGNINWGTGGGANDDSNGGVLFWGQEADNAIQITTSGEIECHSNSIAMNTGGGSGGGDLFMDSGTIEFDNSSSLSTDGSGNLTFTATSISGLPTTAPSSQSLDYTASESTLSTTPSIYWVTIDEGYPVYLPPVSEMNNRTIMFNTIDSVDESSFEILTNDSSNIQGGSTLSMNGPASISLTSDGSNWWITSSYSM